MVTSLFRRWSIAFAIAVGLACQPASASANPPAQGANETDATANPKRPSTRTARKAVGDCTVWRDVQKTLREAGAPVHWNVPRYCANYKPGFARELMVFVHKSGFSQMMQFCMAWQTEETEPDPDAPGLSERAEAKWSLCALRTEQAGYSVQGAQ